MITLKDFLEVTQYKITDGSKFEWDCYGSNAHILDCVSLTEYSASVVFDTTDQTIYEATVCDFENERAYRLIHPDYKKEYEAEADKRGIDGDQAWDQVKYVDLETDEDFLEKLHGIINDLDYDDRVVVPVDVDPKTLYKLMLAAHKQDLTLNQFMEKAVKDYIEE